MQGQERVEVITRGDVTPKESFLEKMKGDFLAVPYFTERTGVGFVMAYSVGQKFLITGNVSYGESLQKMMFKAGYTFGICDNFSAGPVCWDTAGSNGMKMPQQVPFLQEVWYSICLLYTSPSPRDS